MIAFRTMNASSVYQATGGRVIGPRSARPVSSVGGLRRAPVAPSPLPINLAEDGIHRAHDRDDIRHLVARDDVRQHGEVREGRAAPLHPVWLGAAVADDVATAPAPRPPGTRGPLAPRPPHPPHPPPP